MSRDVLIISYHFPPDAAVGALRWQKFAEYLPEHGYQPHVLTVGEKHIARLDTSRSTDLSPDCVHRTGLLPNPREVALRGRAGFLRLIRAEAALRRVEENEGRESFTERDRVAAGGWATAKRLLLSLCWLPDDRLGWFPPAVMAGLRLCRRRRFAAMVSSGPPHTAHLVGLALKRFHDIRWLADFRDPWTSNPGKPASVRSAVSDRLEAILERRVVRAADRVIAVNGRLRDRFVRDYSEERPEKFVTLTNGFDGREFGTLPDGALNEAFTITHVGTLYLRRSPLALLQAVAALIREGIVRPEEIRVRFVGFSGDGHQLDRFVPSLGLGSVVESIGPVSHGEALAAMRGADLLLLLAQGQPDQIPAKAFEYLAAGPPILAITEEGATTDLVVQSGGVVSRDDVQQIREALLGALEKRRSTEARGRDAAGDRSAIVKYDYRRLVIELGALLNGSSRRPEASVALGGDTR